MKHPVVVQLLLVILLTLFVPGNSLGEEKDAPIPTIADKVEGMKQYGGWFDFWWDAKTGKIWLQIDKLETEFLCVNSLSAGVGSNDIGLDRNQLGKTRVVKFVRSGPKILLMQPNYDYRAISENVDERRSVEEAFAVSVLWGFMVAAEENGKVLVDFTPFLLRDAHDVSGKLKRTEQGSFKVDDKRSMIYRERTKNFPSNSEFEAVVTFAGEPQGAWISSVTPSPESVTVRMHHSFIELPDGNYRPRVLDPRSGYFGMSYQDYATPISQPLVKRFINRHRLNKKDPSAKLSEPVEPIVYYIDRGAPEPIRSALIEGASWWDEAFEAAGYKNAFQVKMLPEDADPMDVRYNIINWVHRSTRGWSYGSSVTDPRTGEIIKGHVLLGSLRVRQDFLIAQGMIEAYGNGSTPDPRLEQMALARLRQLSAHEVGHTLGIAHNFAASGDNRASVMDYPSPYITLTDAGELDLSDAYDTGIGEWDKQVIRYGYQDFAAGVDEEKALRAVLQETIDMGLDYISDRDARPNGGAHPAGHLWDNGTSATDELRRISAVRKRALEKFGEQNISVGAPLATLERVLVPLYLSHRYQVEATAKLIGGVEYNYTMRGDGQPLPRVVNGATQRGALDALLETLKPEFLAIPERIIALLPPQPIGFSRGRELFKARTGLTFDPLAAAESSVEHTLSLVLNPQRLARLVEQNARNTEQLSVSEMLDTMSDKLILDHKTDNSLGREISLMVEKIFFLHLLELAGDENVHPRVVEEALWKATRIKTRLQNNLTIPRAHSHYLIHQFKLFEANPNDFKRPPVKEMPDGSPIGCGEHF